MKAFAELTEREILAVAISAEEEDSRICMSFAELGGRDRTLPGCSRDGGGSDDSSPHAARTVRAVDSVAICCASGAIDVGFLRRRRSGSRRSSLGVIRKKRRHGVRCRTILARGIDGARARVDGRSIAPGWNSMPPKSPQPDRCSQSDVRADEHTLPAMSARSCAQPGLAGLMDVVSTLAPLFAAAFATHQNWQTFLRRTRGLDRGGHHHGIRRGSL